VTDNNVMRGRFEAALLAHEAANLVRKAPGLSDREARLIIAETWLVRDGDGYEPAAAQTAWVMYQAAHAEANSLESMEAGFEHYYGLPYHECDPFMQASWRAPWNASRQGLVVAFPDRRLYVEEYDDLEGGDFNYARYLSDLRAILEGHGIKCEVQS